MTISLAPAAAAMATVIQMLAAVVRPRTDSRRVNMMSAPMNPSPETICAATREGSTSTRPGETMSPKPNLLAIMNSAEPSPTTEYVRIPADFCRTCRSMPMRADNPNATASSYTLLPGPTHLLA